MNKHEKEEINHLIQVLSRSANNCLSRLMALERHLGLKYVDVPSHFRYEKIEEEADDAGK